MPLQRRTKRPKAATEAERRRRAVEATTKYIKTAKGRYSAHKANARKRGVPFLLTYDEWLCIWMQSGHFNARGNKTANGYVMARHGDRGPYAVGNVAIIRHGDNVVERNRLYAQRRARMLEEDFTDDWHHVHSAADAE